MYSRLLDAFLTGAEWKDNGVVSTDWDGYCGKYSNSAKEFAPASSDIDYWSCSFVNGGEGAVGGDWGAIWKVVKWSFGAGWEGFANGKYSAMEAEAKE